MRPGTVPAATADLAAVRLALAIKRLRVRLREAAWASGVDLPIAQLAIVKRLCDDGPTTAAMLAAAEHVSHQAITQSLAALRRAALVRTARHPRDGRKHLVSVTTAGRRLLGSAVASRDAWLAQAIERSVRPGERAALHRAIELLERLADAGGSGPVAWKP